jgi:tryptophan-rich sensory protein
MMKEHALSGRERPTVGRLAVYLVLTAAFTGLIAGGANAAGAYDWVYQDLDRPGWLLPGGLLTMFWVAKTMLLAFALWSVERFGREGWRWLGAAGVLGTIACGLAWTIVFFFMRDVSLGLLAVLASWVTTIFAAWSVGRASVGSGAFLWLPLIFQSYALAASFELMRLNTGL